MISHPMTCCVVSMKVNYSRKLTLNRVFEGRHAVDSSGSKIKIESKPFATAKPHVNPMMEFMKNTDAGVRRKF
jgi:hypothetical protein